MVVETVYSFIFICIGRTKYLAHTYHYSHNVRIYMRILKQSSGAKSVLDICKTLDSSRMFVEMWNTYVFYR